MADDIVGLLTAACECGPLDPDDACLSCLARVEIERLRELCNDLHHDATCLESFCRLCGEGVREWEARQ